MQNGYWKHLKKSIAVGIQKKTVFFRMEVLLTEAGSCSADLRRLLFLGRYTQALERFYDLVKEKIWKGKGVLIC